MTPEQPIDPPSRRGRPWLARPTGPAVALVVVLLVLGAWGGYALGRQRPAMRQAQVRCLSAPGGISCTDDADAGNAEFWVPRDVAWTDSGGRVHLGDRPACLPPSARGARGPVGITWVTVEVAGTSWKQAVGVDC
jgi:hypothetical protein